MTNFILSHDSNFYLSGGILHYQKVVYLGHSFFYLCFIARSFWIVCGFLSFEIISSRHFVWLVVKNYRNLSMKSIKDILLTFANSCRIAVTFFSVLAHIVSQIYQNIPYSSFSNVFSFLSDITTGMFAHTQLLRRTFLLLYSSSGILSKRSISYSAEHTFSQNLSINLDCLIGLIRSTISFEHNTCLISAMLCEWKI